MLETGFPYTWVNMIIYLWCCSYVCKCFIHTIPVAYMSRPLPRDCALSLPQNWGAVRLCSISWIKTRSRMNQVCVKRSETQEQPHLVTQCPTVRLWRCTCLFSTVQQMYELYQVNGDYLFLIPQNIYKNFYLLNPCLSGESWHFHLPHNDSRLNVNVKFPMYFTNICY